jgi:hypothetical protein
MTITTRSDPDHAVPVAVTVLRGPVVDQSALHGLLTRLRDVGLPLISVARVESGPMKEPDIGEREGR